MEALRTSYKCLVISLVLGLLVGFFTWAPTPVVNAGGEFAAIGGACDCSSTTSAACPGCREYSYTVAISAPPDTGTAVVVGTACTATHCAGSRDDEDCVF